MRAAEANDLEMLEFLIEHGALINAQNRVCVCLLSESLPYLFDRWLQAGWTAIMFAVEEGHADSVELLAEQGAKLLVQTRVC